VQRAVGACVNISRANQSDMAGLAAGQLGMWPRTSPCGPSRVTPSQVGLDGGQSLETCPPTTNQLHASSIRAPHYERLRSAGLPLPTACAAVERIRPLKSARVQIGGHLDHSCAPERSCS